VDSAVVTALCADALGAENVITVNMPSKHNSDLTKDIAKDIADMLGVTYLVAPIQDAVDMTRTELEAITGKAIATNGPNTLVYENIQARDRSARILSGIASLYDAVFTNNGNKVEAYEGYATLYGDVSGAIAPLGDLLKGQVYDIAREYVAEGKLPQSVVDVKPSAELSGNQDIMKGMGDPFVYEYQDQLVKYLEDYQKNPEDVVRLFIS
jgi:NAD+ synthase (glutamine-hydrolysing)